jgi:hypothetical protein
MMEAKKAEKLVAVTGVIRLHFSDEMFNQLTTEVYS